MPRVPIVEQKSGQRALPAGSVSQPLAAPQLSLPQLQYNPAGAEAAQRLAGTVEKAVGNIAMAAKQRGDQIALIDAQRQIDSWEENYINGALAKRGKDAFDLPNTLGTQYDKDMLRIRDSLANTDQQIAFDKLALSRRGSIMQTLYGHERREMDSYAKQQVDGAVTSSINRASMYYSNPDMAESSINSAKDVIAAYGKMQGMPNDSIANQQLEAESKARLGVLSRLADTNPGAAITYYRQNISKFTASDTLAIQRLLEPVQRKHKAKSIADQVLAGTLPAISRDEIIAFVMNDLEGGDKLVSDSDGLTKYGINSKANPDIDVAGLDEAGANALYKERYWDKINADKMRPDLRLVAFDTAVNHGVGKAEELIVRSGGDPRKLIELRSEEYDRLARSNPEKYGASLGGWKNRLDKLSAQLDLIRGKLPDEMEISQRVDGLTDETDVAQDAKTMLQNHFKAIAQSRKAVEQAASDEAWNYIQNAQEVPASVESRMNPKDIAAMRNKSPANPEIYERLRGQVLAGNDVNLSEYRWQLGNKYDDLLKLQQEPAKQVNARKVDDVIKSSTKILLGRGTPKNKEDFAKVEAFRRAVQVEIDGLQQVNGKPATADDVQKITDRLLLQVSTDEGLFGTEKRFFELGRDEEYEVEGIPSNRAYFVGGEPVEYTNVLGKITDYLQSQNEQLTPENISSIFKILVRQGVIVEKRL